MRTRFMVATALIASLLLVAGLSYGITLGQEAAPQRVGAVESTVGTGFTYQGSLADGGAPANGTHDFQFNLHTTATGGSTISTEVAEDVSVINGRFTTILDFGQSFRGDAYWLEIGVRPGNSLGVFTILTPRQALTAVPYALGLRPGAKIFGNQSGALLNIYNTYTGLASGLSVLSEGALGFGIFAKSASEDATIYAENVATAGDSDAIQAVARSFFGEAVEGINTAGGDAIIFLGCSASPCVGGVRQFVVRANGKVTAEDSFTGGGADYADMMAVSGEADDYSPGDVLVINVDGLVALSKRPNASNVAGVYSTDPAFIGDPQGIPAETQTLAEKETAGNRVPVGLVGIVPTKVSAENGPIQGGDLLTTSNLPGHAMKAVPLSVGGIEFYAPGTIIGKALGSLDSGTGKIDVLVTLQ